LHNHKMMLLGSAGATPSVWMYGVPWNSLQHRTDSTCLMILMFMLLNYKRKLSKCFRGEEGEKTYINGSNLVTN